MNYSESELIIDKLRGSDSVLINCHRHPDPDSVASALALKLALEKMGKTVRVVSPDPVPSSVVFLDGTKEIDVLDFASLDFEEYDLFFILDTSSWTRVVNNEELSLPSIPLIIIDHHKDNSKFGEINIIDTKVSCASEVLYRVFQDWGVVIDNVLATYLITGIMGDTGGLQFSSATPETYRVVAELEEKGANKAQIMLNLFKSYDSQTLAFIGHVLSKLTINKEKKFAWSGINYSEFEKLGKPEEGKGTVVDLFFQQIKDTDFGFVMVEYEPENFTVSFRSRTGVDISGYAIALGGGGHPFAASARFKATSYEEAVQKVLDATN